MTYLAINVLLAVIWAALWGSLDPVNLIGGFVFGFAALWCARRLAGPPLATQYFRAVPQALILLVYFLKELVLSCLMVARDCIAPRPRLQPAILRLPIADSSDLEIFLLSNLITLTPGTLTLDVAADRSHLLIHTIYAQDPDALIAALNSGMVRRVRAVFHG